MAFDILSAEGEDALHWAALVNALPAEHRDIHFLPDYGRMYRHSYGFSSHLAVYRAGEDFVIQPFVDDRYGICHLCGLRLLPRALPTSPTPMGTADRSAMYPIRKAPIDSTNGSLGHSADGATKRTSQANLQVSTLL